MVKGIGFGFILSPALPRCMILGRTDNFRTVPLYVTCG